MNLKYILIFLLFLPFSVISQTNSKNKTLTNKVNAFGIENNLFDSNLDSLLKLSYIKNSFSGRKDTKLTIVSDSLAKKKLSKIETYISLPYNKEVNSFIKFYTHSSNKLKVEAMLGLAQHYKPSFEKILKKHKLPLELQYLAMSGSALFPAASSHSGASGIWQLSYPVAKRYGLSVTSYTDERRDLEKSTMAAAKYLKEMYNIYHDWHLAIAAYHCGAAGVNKAISRANGERDFWKIYKFLPQYSREYLPAFIASVYLINEYKNYNILPLQIEENKQIKTLKVTKKVHFGQIAEVLNISMQELKDLNPEYKRGIIQPINDNNTLKLSDKYVANFQKLEDSIYNYKATVFFQAPKTIVIPPKVVSSGARSSSNYEVSTPKNKAKLVYKIKSGDNLGLIAQWYNTNVKSIKSWNNLYYKKTIYPGQSLNIYVPKYEVSKYKNVNTMSYNQKQKLAGKKTSSSTSTSTASNTKTKSSSSLSSGFSISNSVKSSSSYVYYKVKQGDNLWDISRKFENTSVEKIKNLNNLNGKYRLQAGQILKIKKK